MFGVKHSYKLSKFKIFGCEEIDKHYIYSSDEVNGTIDIPISFKFQT